jgi:hypothetical protein
VSKRAGVIRNAPDGIKATASSVSAASKPYARFKPPTDPKVLEQLVKGYDPEAEFVSTTTLAEHYAKAVIQRTPEGQGESRISGTLVTAPNARGRRVVPFRGWDALEEVTQSDAYRAMKLRETHGVYMAPAGVKRLREAVLNEDSTDWFSLGEQAPSGAMSEWHPLLMGPYHRQLYLHDFLDQASKAFEAYNHNPILRAALNIGGNFVMGDGPKLIAANPACQAVWDEWVRGVESYGGTFQDKMRMLYRDGCLIGETFVYSPTDQATGMPVLKLWDATTVWEVVTDPRDIDSAFYAYRQFMTQYQLPLAAVAAQKPVLISDYVIEQVPSQDWLQVKVNATIGEKRGRSDLFSVLGWGKRFKDFYNAAVVNAQINNAFVMWWNVNGSQADVDALRANQDFSMVPPPGTSLFTNNAVVPSFMRGNTAASDTISAVGEALLGLIATSMNLPPEYLGVAGAGTRATALTRSEPAAKTFEQRQALVREVVMWLYRRVINAAQAQGRLPLTQPRRATISQLISAARGGDLKKARAIVEAMKTKGALMEPLDITAEVIMPDLQPEDRSTVLKDLTVLRTTGVISQETYGRQSAELMNLKQYDFDEEQARIRDEANAGITGPTAPPASMAGPENPKGSSTYGSSQDNQEYRRDTKGKPAQP